MQKIMKRISMIALLVVFVGSFVILGPMASLKAKADASTTIGEYANEIVENVAPIFDAGEAAANGAGWAAEGSAAQAETAELGGAAASSTVCPPVAIALICFSVMTMGVQIYDSIEATKICLTFSELYRRDGYSYSDIFQLSDDKEQIVYTSVGRSEMTKYLNQLHNGTVSAQPAVPLGDYQFLGVDTTYKAYYNANYDTTYTVYCYLTAPFATGSGIYYLLLSVGSSNGSGAASGEYVTANKHEWTTSVTWKNTAAENPNNYIEIKAGAQNQDNWLAYLDTMPYEWDCHFFVEPYGDNTSLNTNYTTGTVTTNFPNSVTAPNPSQIPWSDLVGTTNTNPSDLTVGQATTITSTTTSTGTGTSTGTSTGTGTSTTTSTGEGTSQTTSTGDGDGTSSRSPDDLNNPTDHINFKPLENINLDKFPFCIPFDLYNAIKNLVVPSTPPAFDINLSGSKFLPGGSDMKFDMSQFEPVAAVARWFETLLFIVALMMITRRLILA